MKFLATVLRSRGYKPGIVANQLRNDVRKYARYMIRESYEQTTEHWTGEKPDFVVVRTQVAPTRSRTVELEMGLGGDEQGVKKWIWLDKGTAIRHARMHKDFRRKTTPNRLATGKGAGPSDPVFISKRHVQLPGIEPRRWTEIILRKHARGRGVDSFASAMRDSLQIGIRKAHQGYTTEK